jgi:hypothetical protein
MAHATRSDGRYCRGPFPTPTANHGRSKEQQIQLSRPSITDAVTEVYPVKGMADGHQSGRAGRKPSWGVSGDNIVGWAPSARGNVQADTQMREPLATSAENRKPGSAQTAETPPQHTEISAEWPHSPRRAAVSAFPPLRLGKGEVSALLLPRQGGGDVGELPYRLMTLFGVCRSDRQRFGRDLFGDLLNDEVAVQRGGDGGISSPFDHRRQFARLELV